MFVLGDSLQCGVGQRPGSVQHLGRHDHHIAAATRSAFLANTDQHLALEDSQDLIAMMHMHRAVVAGRQTPDHEHRALQAVLATCDNAKAACAALRSLGKLKQIHRDASYHAVSSDVLRTRNLERHALMILRGDFEADRRLAMA